MLLLNSNCFVFVFVGTIDFNLSFMPLPVKRSRNCRISQIPDGKSNVKTENLFKRKRMEGWWPIYESQTKKGKTKLKIKVCSCIAKAKVTVKLVVTSVAIATL